MIALTMAGCPGDDSGTNDASSGGQTSTGNDPTTTSGDPGTTTDDPGTTTDDPGTTTDDPGTTSDPDSSSGDPMGVNFEWNLMGYPHDGQDVAITVVEAGTMNTVLTMNATFAGMEHTFSDASGPLTDGASYDVYWYVDVNGNGACDPPADDHSWEMLGVMAGPMGVSADHTHDAMWVDVCANF